MLSIPVCLDLVLKLARCGGLLRCGHSLSQEVSAAKRSLEFF
jgi:hypothetical protein